MLVTFFRRGSVLDKDTELVWSHDEIPNVQLSEQVGAILNRAQYVIVDNDLMIGLTIIL